MILTLEPTDRIERVEGKLCRVWQGTTDGGTPVVAHVACVSPQTHDPAVNALFERELEALPPARREAVSYDLRFLS